MRQMQKQEQNSEEHQRVINFLLGTRRCGTSLLAAILNECGADFGPVQKTPEFHRAGYMEDPLVGKAESYFRKYYELRKTFPFLPVCCINWIRKHAITIFQKVVQDNRAWVKNGALISCLADLQNSLGFQPKVLGIVRHPVENVASFSNSKGAFGMESDVETMFKRYYNDNQKLLLHIENYGGCLISFHDLTDRKKTNWADAVSKAFPEFKKQDLIHARNKLVDKRTKNLGKPQIIYLPQEYQQFWNFLVQKTQANASKNASKQKNNAMNKKP